VEPIYRFCCKRLSDRYDAEDLAGEIICHILEGMNRYQIGSLDAWVWRIAHNRYARFINNRNKNPIMLYGGDELGDIEDYTDIDEDAAEHRYETVFRYLHTLSSGYRNILVDYYIGGLSVRVLSEKYSLPETTIKWRLNVGRRKIRDRIGEDRMDKVYQRINWNTTVCNGNMDSNRYLYSQIARSICEAAYKKPLTIEEISIRTGIPSMYIEDELPRLEYGDAVCKVGDKYATNFIILHLKDRKQTEEVSASVVNRLADQMETLLKEGKDKISTIDFFGSDFGVDRLGHIIVPYLLRRKIRDLKDNRLKLENGPYPPRKDGGFGWFIVEETTDEREWAAEHNTGCNTAIFDDEDNSGKISYAYYYWIAEYFEQNIYSNRGLRWMSRSGILEASSNGILPENLLSAEDITSFMAANLVVKTGDTYRLNFPYFTEAQFSEFISLFGHVNDQSLEDALTEWIGAVRKNFENFVPKHLHDQINQWVSGYLYQMIGCVTDELICRGVLRKPDPEKPFTDGVFYVEGRFIHP